jgi:hypothetical protein
MQRQIMPPPRHRLVLPHMKIRQLSEGTKMSESERLPDFLILPREEELNRKLFEDKPVRAIKKYLECFDEDGHQVLNVPHFVLEVIASNFLQFMNGTFESVDAAFGDKVARQRQAIASEEKSYEIVFDLHCKHLEMKELPKGERIGTPFEMALNFVANQYNMSTDNVRRIHKKAKIK